MKASYFFRPIWQMFDFKGVTGRAEYFTYTVTSCVVLVLLWLAGLLALIINWSNFLPPEMLHDGMLPFDGGAMFAVLMFGPYVTQLPMFALTVRRLRDQYASWSTGIWLFIPFLGPAVLFGYAFVPTFVDYEVRLPDGTITMRSQQLADRRFRNTLIGAGVVAFGATAVTEAMSDSVSGLQLEGGKKTPRNPNTRLFNDDGTPNNRNSILATTTAHTRGFGSVKGSQRKRTM